MRWKIYFALAGLVCACAGMQELRAQAAPPARAAPAAPAAQEQAAPEQAARDVAMPPRRVPVADYPIQEGYIDSRGVLIY